MPTGTKRPRITEKSASEATSTTAVPTGNKRPRISAESFSEATPTTAGNSSSLKPANNPPVPEPLKVATVKKSAQEVIVKAIGYADHKESLDAAIKELKRHVKRDRTDGYEEQGEMMTDISKEILKWLPKLWRLMTKLNGADLKRVQQSLVLCTDTVKSIENCNSRCEYSDMSFKITITDYNKKVIYKSSAYIVDTLAWMWKELLVHAASKNHPTEAMLTVIERRHLTHSVFSLIRKPGEQKDEEEDEDEFWDAHWSDAMKDSASQMYAKRQQKQVESSKKTA